MTFSRVATLVVQKPRRTRGGRIVSRSKAIMPAEADRLSTGPTDAELIARCAAQDRAAFRTLYASMERPFAWGGHAYHA